MPHARSHARKKKTPKRVLALPDLEHAKSAVISSLTSRSGQRTCDHAIREFVGWYCSEPRLAFNRTVVLRYRISSEVDHWVALVYQIRNAFAHDIARPKWHISGRFAREYRIGRVYVDLTSLHAAPFDYSQIGGPDKLFVLKEYGLKLEAT